MFPNQTIHEDYKHKEMKFMRSSRPMELDIFLPELNLAFEYQGYQHFHDSEVFGSAEVRIARDQEKRQACDDSGKFDLFTVLPWEGITLIEIPYWWPKNIDLLRAALEKAKKEKELIYAQSSR